ncbi:MAG: YqeG family HAD IIIA-type phosphatase [Clostridium sp.]|nr:YqeG family HAD IIIA-type phosphatase [Clostridium sp.]MCM1547242.1 YqeG family HAD IIIA-type phosphatase [Ruminococcus sp.]
MLFRADYAFWRVTEITPEFLKKNNIKGLLLDIDNTLTTHDNPVPADGVPDWITLMKNSGIKLVLVSNNHPPRVEPFADMLGLEFVCEGKKPLSSGFNRAQQRMGIPFSQLAVVGDQIFTDILGANLKRVRGIFVYPIEHENTRFFKLKRLAEKPFLPKLTKR